MKRRHLYELEDQEWFPRLLRDAVTDFLSEALVVGGRVYSPAVPLLAHVIKQAGAERVIDLCSGGSGPWTHLQGELDTAGCSVDLVLTDKFPNVRALRRAVGGAPPGRMSYHDAPVDATAVPDALLGVRTVFTAFHHFRPDQAARLLQDAYAQRCGLGVFEFTERSPAAIARTLVVAPLLVLLTTPTLRPGWRQLTLTYVLPVIPLAVTWDAVVSNLRTYSVDELRLMVLGLNDPDYVWEAGTVPGEGRNPSVTYLLGYPLTSDAPASAAHDHRRPA